MYPNRFELDSGPQNLARGLLEHSFARAVKIWGMLTTNKRIEISDGSQLIVTPTIILPSLVDHSMTATAGQTTTAVQMRIGIKSVETATVIRMQIREGVAVVENGGVGMVIQRDVVIMESKDDVAVMESMMVGASGTIQVTEVALTNIRTVEVATGMMRGVATREEVVTRNGIAGKILIGIAFEMFTIGITATIPVITVEIEIT